MKLARAMDNGELNIVDTQPTKDETSGGLSWDCPGCKAMGLEGNFCPFCGGARPTVDEWSPEAREKAAESRKTGNEDPDAKYMQEMWKKRQESGKAGKPVKGANDPQPKPR